MSDPRWDICPTTTNPPERRNRRFLVICQYGHSRSAAMVRILHKPEYRCDAICAGVGTASPYFIRDLMDHVDLVITMTPEASELCQRLTHPDSRKLIHIDIGPDKWSNPYHPELLALCEQKLKEKGLI